jgi:hypothetical protein
LTIKVPPSFEAEELEMREAREKRDEVKRKLSQTGNGHTHVLAEELQRVEHKRARLEEEYIARLQLLGARPAIEHHQYEQVEKQDREGVWGKLVQFLKGPKETVCVVTVSDDSSRREHDRKVGAIESTYEKRKDQLEQEIGVKQADLNKERQKQIVAEQLRKEREQADKALEKVRKMYEKRVEDAQSIALDASKKAIMRCYERGCDDLEIRLRATVKQASAIVEEYVHSLAMEIDEVIRDLQTGLDRIREMRSAKESEKMALLAKLNDVWKRITRLHQTAAEIGERLRLFLAEGTFSGGEGF